MDQELIQIALSAPESTSFSHLNIKSTAAKYFESKNDIHNAILLYQKAGNINKAIDLCINNEMFDVLKTIGMFTFVFFLAFGPL